MTTYNVTAWCSLPNYTTFEVEAESVEDALAKAKTQAKDECPEPCNGPSYDWDEFEICADDASEYIRCLKPERAAEIAAQEMLEALRLCEEVLSDLARLDDGTPSVSALNMARDAIAKATEQQGRAP
jgi:hypothetical protein